MAELQKGLEQAATYLQETSKVAKDPAVGGFYLPPAAFDDPKLAATSGVFLSEDGRHARMVVIGTSDPFSPTGSKNSVAVERAASRRPARHPPRRQRCQHRRHRGLQR